MDFLTLKKKFHLSSSLHIREGKKRNWSIYTLSDNERLFRVDFNDMDGLLTRRRGGKESAIRIRSMEEEEGLSGVVWAPWTSVSGHLFSSKHVPHVVEDFHIAIRRLVLYFLFFRGSVLLWKVATWHANQTTPYLRCRYCAARIIYYVAFSLWDIIVKWT